MRGLIVGSNIFKHIALSPIYTVFGSTSPERSITGIIIGHAIVQPDAINSKIETRHRYSGAKMAARWNCAPGCGVGFLRFDSRRSAGPDWCSCADCNNCCIHPSHVALV